MMMTRQLSSLSTWERQAQTTHHSPCPHSYPDCYFSSVLATGRLELRKGTTLPEPELSSRLDLVLNARAIGEPSLLSKTPRSFPGSTEIIQLSTKRSPHQVGPALQECDFSVPAPLRELLLPSSQPKVQSDIYELLCGPRSHLCSGS